MSKGLIASYLVASVLTFGGCMNRDKDEEYHRGTFSEGRFKVSSRNIMGTHYGNIKLTSSGGRKMELMTKGDPFYSYGNFRIMNVSFYSGGRLLWKVPSSEDTNTDRDKETIVRQVAFGVGRGAAGIDFLLGGVNKEIIGHISRCDGGYPCHISQSRGLVSSPRDPQMIFNGDSNK